MRQTRFKGRFQFVQPRASKMQLASQPSCIQLIRRNIAVFMPAAARTAARTPRAKMEASLAEFVFLSWSKK